MVQGWVCGDDCLGCSMFSVRARSVLLVSLVGAVAAFAVALLVGASSRADDSAGAASTTAPAFAAPPSGSGDVASLRTENSRTYRRADGFYTAEISARPVNFRGATGAWKPIDTDLKPAAGGGLETTAAATVVALPASLDDPAKVSTGERSVSFSLQGAGAVAPTVAGDTATYADALGGVDAAYEALATGVKETLTLADATAPSTYRFSLQASSGLTPALQPDGSVVFDDSDGTQRFTLPAPTVQAAGDATATTDHVAYHLSDDGERLSVVVDPAWLAAASFPVKIDPSVTSGADVYCTLTSGSSATTNDCGAETQKVGHSGSHTYRTIAHFDGLNGDVPRTASIMDAHLDMWFDSQTSGSAVSQIDAVGLSRSFTSAATWNKYDATHNWTTAGGDLLADTAGGLQANDTTMRPEFVDGWVTWDVGRLAEGWVRDASTNHGLMVKAHNESLSNVLTVDTQLLAIDYEWHPGVESDQSYETVGIDDRSTIKVNRASGNIAAGSTDIHLPGADGLDLDVGRTFNGQDLGDPLGGFGSAWANSINGAAFVNDRLWYDDARTIYANGGAIYRFDRDYAHDTATTNAFVSPPNIDADLTDDTDTGIATLTFRTTGTVWTYADSFDGQTFTLGQVSDGHGHHIDLTPEPDDPTKIAEITDTNGHELDFSYGTSGELTRITDATGSHWDYTTDTSSGHNILTAFTDPDDNTTTYTYADDIPGVWDKLQMITDPDGHATDLEYGPDGDYSQITKITQHPDATPAHDKVWSFDYSPDPGVGDICTDPAAIGRTVETNNDDDITTYCYNNTAQVIQTLGAPTAEPPTNTVAPTITGTARDGQTLTTDDGTWTGTTPITYTRQWERCNTASANCTDISGATASTYTLTATDIGSKLKVTVTATNAAGATPATSTATATVAATAPTNTAPPSISGSAEDAGILTTDSGAWTGSDPMTFDYQWRRCDDSGGSCSDIEQEHDASLALSTDDVGHALRVSVTATNAGGVATATSEPSATVDGIAPANIAAPHIMGARSVGEAGQIDVGDWVGSEPRTTHYVWQWCDSAGASCSDIVGAADAPAYTPITSDVGSTLRATVQVTNPYGNATAITAVTSTVEAAVPAVATDIEGVADPVDPLDADHLSETAAIINNISPNPAIDAPCDVTCQAAVNAYHSLETELGSQGSSFAPFNRSSSAARALGLPGVGGQILDKIRGVMSKAKLARPFAALDVPLGLVGADVAVWAVVYDEWQQAHVVHVSPPEAAPTGDVTCGPPVQSTPCPVIGERLEAHLKDDEIGPGGFTMPADGYLYEHYQDGAGWDYEIAPCSDNWIGVPTAYPAGATLYDAPGFVTCPPDHPELPSQSLEIAVIPFDDLAQTVEPYDGQTPTPDATAGVDPRWTGPGPFSTTLGPIHDGLSDGGAGQPDPAVTWLGHEISPRCNPDPMATTVEVPAPQADEPGQSYADCLVTLGLSPHVVSRAPGHEQPGVPPGAVVQTSPPPGTEPQPGDTVTVTINPPSTDDSSPQYTAYDALLKHNPGLDPEVARVVADRCIELAELADPAEHAYDDNCTGTDDEPGLPIFVTGNGKPLPATEHDIDALGLNPSWTTGSNPGWFLQVRADRGAKSTWYANQDQTGWPDLRLPVQQETCAGSVPMGIDCDEFPYWQATSGGSATLIPKPSLRLIAAGSNRSQGGFLINFLSKCAVTPGRSYLVLATTQLPTQTNICNNG
jgi:hypothetical protein